MSSAFGFIGAAIDRRRILVLTGSVALFAACRAEPLPSGPLIYAVPPSNDWEAAQAACDSLNFALRRLWKARVPTVLTYYFPNDTEPPVFYIHPPGQ